MKLSEAERVQVSRAVWSEFVKLRGEGAPNPTAREWYVLFGWLDKDIPLPVILRAFSEFQGRPRLLTAMETPVERAYQYWFQAMGGV